jgi:hypothetical protein
MDNRKAVSASKRSYARRDFDPKDDFMQTIPPESKEDGIVITTEVTIKESFKIPTSEGGDRTVGSMVDEYLARHAVHEGRVSGFSMAIDEKTWNGLAAFYRAQFYPDGLPNRKGEYEPN